MRDYEIVYIFKSGFTPEEIEGKLTRYHQILTGAEDGEIKAVEQWGKRQLAYPIKKEPNGHYVVAQFTTDPDRLAELERILKLDEDLLRYLIVIAEGELPAPPSFSMVEVAGEVVAAAPAGGAEATAVAEGESPAAVAEGESPAAVAEAEEEAVPEAESPPAAEAGSEGEADGEEEPESEEAASEAGEAEPTDAAVVASDDAAAEERD